MRKLRFLLLSLILPVSAVLPAQTPIENNQGTTLYYTFEDTFNSATVEPHPDAKYAGAVNIPEQVTHNGKTYDVKRIADKAFLNQRNIVEVTIPKTITHIGGHAFKGCDALKVVNYNANNCIEGATRTGNQISSAFEDCKGIVNLNLGNDVVNIPEYLFWGCTGITELTIPENVKRIGGGAFIDCAGITRLNFNAVRCTSMYTKNGAKVTPAIVNSQISEVRFGPLVTAIPDYAFFGFGSLTTITIPNNITMIGGAAFQECRALTSVIFNAEECNVAHSMNGDNIIPSFNNPSITHVTFGSKVTRIPDYLFWGCSGLKEVIFSENVERIGVSAFFGCTGITSVTISESVESIGANAFGKCPNLTSVRFNAINCTNMSSVEGGQPVAAFDNPAITSITFGNEVKRIPDHAFEGCGGLTAITIPETVEYIGYRAFYGCRSIEKLVIPEHVHSIGGLAFSGCDKLYHLTFNAKNCSGVTKIENGKHLSAFASCQSLKDVVFGPEVTIIPDYIFDGCSAIERVIIPSKVRSIGSFSFKDCNDLTMIDYRAENCESVTSDGSTQSGLSSKTLVTLIIAEGVRNIPPYAFDGCTRLSAVNLPSTVETIGHFAFADCASLKKIVIPAGIKNIDGGAFQGCLNAKQVNFNATDCRRMGTIIEDEFVPVFTNAAVQQVVIGANVESVPDYAFQDCASIEKLSIGKNVKRIGKLAFKGIKSLSVITIPENIESIGGAAFADCENLEQINFNAINCHSAFDIIADTVTYPFVGKNKIEYIVFGKKVTSIPEGMFYNCQVMSEVTIPRFVTTLGGMAFGNCPQLQNVIFDADDCNNAASKIDGEMRSAFYGSDQISYVEFGNIHILPDYLFKDCAAIKKMLLPTTIDRIGAHAFDGCTSLTRLQIPENISAIGEYAFRNTGLTTLAIHEYLTEIGEGAFDGCFQLGAIRCKKQNQSFFVKGGILYTADGSRIVALPASMNDKVQQPAKRK